MLALSERRSDRDWPRIVMVTAIVNALAVGMYWRLWLQDPALVNSSGPLPWWLDWYLHGLGPLLQWIDALFVHGAFRRPQRAILPFLGLVGVYLGWVEGFVAPANSFPLGRVASGLPYPFLNNMEPVERAVFYGVTTAIGLVALAVFWALGALIRRRR